MNFEELFTEQTRIKITVVKINNQKLTKSIFNQLNRVNPFDKHLELKPNAKFFGYINDKMKWVIWTDGEFVYKYLIKDLYEIIKINVDKHTIADLHHVYSSDIVKKIFYETDFENGIDYSEEIISNVLNIDEQHIFMDKRDIIEEIRDEILKRQIFL